MTTGDAEDTDGLDPVAVDRFGRHLAEALGVDRDGPVAAAEGLFDDWALDSLQVFQMLITVEVMADCMLPPDEIPTMLTVGDAYAYYCDLRRLVVDDV